MLYLLQRFWGHALLSVLLLLLASAAGVVVLIEFLGLIKFLPSYEWREATKLFTGPLMLIPAALLFWPLGIPGWFESVENQILEALRRPVSVAEIRNPTKRSSMFPVMIFLSPLLVWYAVATIVSVGMPMASIALSGKSLHHDFVVEELKESSARYQKSYRLVLKDHTPVGGNIIGPPRQIWSNAKPGDAIRVYGVGNRWGVFYDEIELIKR